MRRFVARLASSALFAAPMAVHAGDTVRSASAADAPATRGTAAAPAADQDFLEYLGSWDGSDEDWVVAGEAARHAPPTAAPATRGAASDPPAGVGTGKPIANASGVQAGARQEQDK